MSFIKINKIEKSDHKVVSAEEIEEATKPKLGEVVLDSPKKD